MRIIAVCALSFLFIVPTFSVSIQEQPDAQANFDDEPKPSGRRMSSLKSAGGINGGKDYSFPIVLPPYGQKDAPTPKPEWGSCLLYLESISVIVFGISSSEKRSAVAVVDGSDKNTYTFGDNAVSCLRPEDTKAGDKAPKDFSFQIQVNVKTPAKAVKLNDATELFTVKDNIRLRLKFQRKSDFSWYLSDVIAQELKVTAGSWLKQDLVVEADKSSDNANRSMKISGYTDYSYACSSTPAAVWDVNKDYSVGISFNNIQLQPFGIWMGKDQTKTKVRFGRKVNDCVGLFSIGSWMGIVVAIILLMVLFFGYLMLNSVQTMDRFDDPKQKQLIINAKE